MKFKLTRQSFLLIGYIIGIMFALQMGQVYHEAGLDPLPEWNLEKMWDEERSDVIWNNIGIVIAPLIAIILVNLVASKYDNNEKVVKNG